MHRDELDQALIAAHDAQDLVRLTALYTDAADASRDADAAAFYLTQAYVFALAGGLPEAATLNRRLAKAGRDELQPDLILT